MPNLSATYYILSSNCEAHSFFKFCFGDPVAVARSGLIRVSPAFRGWEMIFYKRILNSIRGFPSAKKRYLRTFQCHCFPVLLALVFFAMKLGMLAQTDVTRLPARLYQQAQKALANDDYDGAIGIYRELIRMEGGSAPLFFQIGMAQYQKGDYDSAAVSLERSLKIHPHFAVAEAFLGLSEAARGSFDLSIPLLEKSFASKDPAVDRELKRSVGARLGDLYSDEGRTRDAEAVYTKLLNNYPNDPQVLYQSFWVYMSRAKQVMNALMQEAPNSYHTHKLLGLLLAERTDYAAAAEQFREALKDNPSGVGLHYELGVLASDSADEIGATNEFEQELRLNPFHAPSYYALAEQAFRNNQFDKAGELYEKAVDCRPTFSDAFVGLCKVARSKGQMRDALDSCNKSIQLDPENKSAHYQLAQIYRKLGEIPKAEAELRVFEKLRTATETKNDLLFRVQTPK